MARTPRPAGSEQDAPEDYQPSDTDLGIGEETEAAAADDASAKISAVMADPVIATAIEQLVQRRVAELAVANGAPQVVGPDLMAGFKLLAQEMAAAINRTTTATMEQMPGHVKPLPPEEIERRAAAWVELQSILADMTRRYWLAVQQGEHLEAERLTPIYILDEDFFGPGEVGNEMFVRGETIRWFGVPGVYMQPRNGIAKRLGELAWTYLGNEGTPSIDELKHRARDALRPSTPGAPGAPEMAFILTESSRGRPGASRVSEMGIAERGPNDVVGTVVKVTKGGYGHGIVTDGPGFAQHAVAPRAGPHQIRGPELV